MSGEIKRYRLPQVSTPINSDDVANKAYVDAAVGGNTFARVVKKVDEVVNNVVVPQDDDELFVALQANKVYGFLFILFIDSPATANFRFLFPLNGNTGQKSRGTAGSAVPQLLDPLDTEIGVTTSGNNEMITVGGEVTTTGIPGNLQLQWAQVTAIVGDTTVFKGSYLLVWEELP